MNKKEEKKEKKIEIGKDTEDIFQRYLKNPKKHSVEDVKILLEELHIHQIELEIQNEELRQREEELARSCKKYIDLYDFAPVGYCTLDSYGKICEINLMAAQQLGRSRAALLHTLLYQYVFEEDRDVLFLHLRKAMALEERQICELRLLQKDGGIFWVQLDTLVENSFDSNSKACKIIIIDISERKKAEKEKIKFEQKMQVTQKLEAVGFLAGGIAHDFNNFLCGLYGCLELARKATNDEKVTEYLDMSLSTIERARSLTNQLLTFSKGGAPSRKVGSLAPFLQETVHFALSGSNVSCLFDMPQDLWYCEFDSSQMSQVIGNIVINAQQAMPTGGIISISALNVPLKAMAGKEFSNADYVKTTIQDTGTGILPEILPRIFDPFFTTKKNGSGLGLSICYSIVKQHGGFMEVESELNKGTSFHIYLPAVSQAQSEPPRQLPSVALSEGRRGRILLMDDQKLVLKAVGQMLKHLGYVVECKEDGKEALDFFIEERKAGRAFDAIILDLTVPCGMGGMEIIGDLRRLDPHLPIVVASGYGEDPVMAEPQKYGFTISLCKPFSSKDLARLLNEYVKKEAKTGE